MTSTLHAAQDDHNAAVLTIRAGVSAAALDSDNRRWETAARAIVALARSLRAHCAASFFCDARPQIDTLTARLVDALDDQIDPHVWAVIEAAARLQARGWG